MIYRVGEERDKFSLSPPSTPQVVETGGMKQDNKTRETELMDCLMDLAGEVKLTRGTEGFM